MSPLELTAALTALGYRMKATRGPWPHEPCPTCGKPWRRRDGAPGLAEAARELGVERTTVARWLGGAVPVPHWAERHLGLMLLERRAMVGADTDATASRMAQDGSGAAE